MVLKFGMPAPEWFGIYGGPVCRKWGEGAQELKNEIIQYDLHLGSLATLAGRIATHIVDILKKVLSSCAPPPLPGPVFLQHHAEPLKF